MLYLISGDMETLLGITAKGPKRVSSPLNMPKISWFFQNQSDLGPWKWKEYTYMGRLYLR